MNPASGTDPAGNPTSCRDARAGPRKSATKGVASHQTARSTTTGILPRICACDQRWWRTGRAMRTCSSCSWTGRGAADAGTQAKRGAEGGVGWVDGRWMLCSAGHTHGGFINRGSVVLLPIGLDGWLRPRPNCHWPRPRRLWAGRQAHGWLLERKAVVVPRLPITRGGRMIRAMSRRPLVGV